jgi:hypothetical protein
LRTGKLTPTGIGLDVLCAGEGAARDRKDWYEYVIDQYAQAQG